MKLLVLATGLAALGCTDPLEVSTATSNLDYVIVVRTFPWWTGYTCAPGPNGAATGWDGNIRVHYNNCGDHQWGSNFTCTCIDGNGQVIETTEEMGTCYGDHRSPYAPLNVCASGVPGVIDPPCGPNGISLGVAFHAECPATRPRPEPEPEPTDDEPDDVPTDAEPL